MALVEFLEHILVCQCENKENTLVRRACTRALHTNILFTVRVAEENQSFVEQMLKLRIRHALVAALELDVEVFG